MKRSKRSRLRTVGTVLSIGLLGTWLETTAACACTGDCNDSGDVTVNELIVAVNIALGLFDVAQCRSADSSGDGAVTINELLVSVNDALSGCPTPTPALVATDTPFATPTLPVTPPPTSSPVVESTATMTSTPPVTTTGSVTPPLTSSPTALGTPTATSRATANATSTATNTPGRMATTSPTTTMNPASTPVPTSTFTRTATLTRTATFTRTATHTAKGTPAKTATPTATATATPFAVPSGGPALTCRFVTGSSQVTFQSQKVNVPVDVVGSQVWHFTAAGADGTRQILGLPAESHFDCLSATIQGAIHVAGCLRMDPAIPAQGVVDCTGGKVGGGYDVVTSVDHNSNQNAVGFPQDPACANTFTNPDGSIASPCIEGVGAACSSARNTHLGVCNSAVHLDQSGVFPAGGVQMSQRLLLRIFPNATCTASLCPADSAPFDATRDIRVSADMSSGSAKGVIFNVDNQTLTLGTTGSGDGASICGLGGAGACVTSAAGAPYTALCADLSAASLRTGRLVAALTALDLPAPIYDVIATLGITCQ